MNVDIVQGLQYAGGYAALMGGVWAIGKGLTLLTPALKWIGSLRAMQALGRGIEAVAIMVGGMLTVIGLIVASILFMVSLASLLVMPLAAVPLWVVVLLILLAMR